jgi:hypothetical protein
MARIKADKLVYKNWNYKEDFLYWKDQLFIPRDVTLRTRIVEVYYDDLLVGYFGVKRTAEIIS